MYSSAGTGCTLRINATHVGSLVNGDTSTGWETTNNFAAVSDSSADPTLTNWTQISHGIEGNHSAGEPHSWVGTPGNHIPAPFGLIGNVIAYHNSSDSTGSINAMVSTSVGDPRAKSSLPAFMVYRSADFASWTYAGPLYTYTKEMSRAECGDLFPIGTGASKITAANVDFGLAAGDAWWVLMWSTPDRNGGGSARNAGVVYLIGKLKGGKFVPASEELQAADYGSGFYASQTVLGPVGERIIMADLGGGVQSLPRSITLTESDMSLNFAPTSALAARHAGTPVRASGVKLAAGDSKQLEGADAFADAMDINVTVSGEAGGSAVVRLRAGNSSTHCRCTHESAWCCKDGPIELMVNFTGNASIPRPMHSLTVTAGRGKITIPVDGSGGAQGGTLRATMRVVIDKQIVEVFTGQTPYSFSYMPLSGGRDVELVAVSGAAEFDVVASKVATTKGSLKTDDLVTSESDSGAATETTTAVSPYHPPAPKPPLVLPPWAPTYNLSLSTALFPTNQSGWWDVDLTRRFGLLNFDWSNAQALWALPPVGKCKGGDDACGSCEEYLAEQCRRVKLVNNETRCLVYRNTELGLEWLSSERSVMNEAHSGFFLNYQTPAMCQAAGSCDTVTSRDDGNAGCCAWGPGATGLGGVYSEPIGPHLNQTFWNMSNSSAADYFVETVVSGRSGLGNRYVDGVALDDPPGIGNEHYNASSNMGLTPRQCCCCEGFLGPGMQGGKAAAECRTQPCCPTEKCTEFISLRKASLKVWQRAQDKMLAANKWSWDYIRGTPPITNATCAPFLRAICTTGLWKHAPWMHSPTTTDPHDRTGPHPTPLFGGSDLAQQVATMLLGRGDYAWLGYNFAGSMPQTNMAPWPALLDTDVGVPAGECGETGAGVFERLYSKGKVRLDCGTYTAVLPGAVAA